MQWKHLRAKLVGSIDVAHVMGHINVCRRCQVYDKVILHSVSLHNGAASDRNRSRLNLPISM